MERSERIGVGVALAGHLLLFGLLSVGFLATPNPLKLQQHPIDVSLVKDVGLEQAAPKPAAEPAPSIAPERGEPEDAPPPAPVTPAPEPKPVPPQPAPPEPAPPKPAPARPAPPKPAPKPAPKEAPPKPAPVAKPAPAPKPVPAKPVPAKAAAKPAPAKPAAKPEPARAAPARPAPSRDQLAAIVARDAGSTPGAKAARPRGSRLGDNFLKGLTDRPSSSKVVAAPAAVMGAKQMADIGSAILRQVQPCANRQVTPGPGAERIRVAVNLRLNRDGSLAAPPRIINHSGVDDENRRYLDRVDDLAIATFTGCSPLRGLPPELYDVQNGWSNFTLRYKLPG